MVPWPRRGIRASFLLCSQHFRNQSKSPCCCRTAWSQDTTDAMLHTGPGPGSDDLSTIGFLGQKRGGRLLLFRRWNEPFAKSFKIWSYFRFVNELAKQTECRCCTWPWTYEIRHQLIHLAIATPISRNSNLQSMNAYKGFTWIDCYLNDQTILLSG